MAINVAKRNVVENISKESVKKYTEVLKKDTIYIKVKRIMDIVLSTIGLFVLSPIFVIIALAIKIESRGPVFFKHTRIGKNGEIIKIYKFRSMVQNAEDLIQKFTPEQMREFKENYKLTDDPRITKIGNFLRKTSLDELPQLINIIKGELSIIGPRPVVQDELEKYGENKEKFLSVTPGLTGYWAANGRSCTGYEKRMEMELYYVDNLSLKMDIKVVLAGLMICFALAGCGCNAKETHENTAGNSQSSSDTMTDDKTNGNNVAEDAGNAVGDVVDGAGEAVKDAARGVSNAARSATGSNKNANMTNGSGNMAGR